MTKLKNFFERARIKQIKVIGMVCLGDAAWQCGGECC